MQAAGSTAGEAGYRENGSDRAERAMSMESAASASLPTTAIPKGALLCCQNARTCVCRLQAPQGFGCIWPTWWTTVPVACYETAPQRLAFEQIWARFIMAEDSAAALSTSATCLYLVHHRHSRLAQVVLPVP